MLRVSRLVDLGPLMTILSCGNMRKMNYIQISLLVLNSVHQNIKFVIDTEENCR